MEIGNGGASSKGGLIPVPDSSDVFKNSVLAPLQSAYLYDESRQFFRYKSAVLVKNPTLERKYNAFRAKRREAGYSEEDLEESYGFLLFDDINKANALGETGVLAGNSTCTTLGDPSKGVYISMYSDCLDLNRWYHGKSGYIAIIRLTKGKVKKVSENYTQNFTAPTVGFDCHVSEQLPSVSAQTSSFLAFERTQCYMYELLDDASNATARSPSAACPFAILSFSYTDTKATIAPPQEKCDEKKAVFHYLPWRGQLEIGSQLYNIGLRSTTGALIPAKLPPVVKVDRAISMLDLRQLLPKAVFETCFAGEAFLDGLYCSLCELVSTEAEETNSLAQLVWEIREKDLALAVLLSDGGFLILLHSSHFLTYDDAWSCATEVLQGLFVFPDSRVVMKDTKFGQKKPSMTSEILQILPVLSYAEGEVEKTSIDPSEELCEVLAQHMQSYTALINPGLASSPSREVSMFPFQYDVPDAHLYSSPEWSDRAMQSFKSYLSRPVSFQLPVSRASEILAAGQEERRREDLDDDVYICISSPEEAPQEMIDPVSTVLEDTLSDLNSPETVETSVENGRSSPGAQDDLTVVPRNVVTNDLQPGHLTKDNEKCSNLSELNKTEGVNNVTPPTSDDLPAELIVSITSAEQSVSDETLNLRAKLQAAEVNSLCDETDYTKKLLDIPKVTSFTGTKLKMHTRLSKGSNKVSKASVEPSNLQTVKTPVEVDSVNIQKDEHTKDLSDHPQLRNPSNWRKLQRRKRKCGKLSTKSRKLRSGTVALPIAEEKKTDPGLQNVESTILVELEVCPLRRKTERWDLKPIISECGRILVPHGATDFTDQITFLKDKLQATKNEQSPEKTLLDAPVDADDTVKLDPESCTAPETAVEEMEAAESVDGGNDLQNITAGDVNPEQNISKQLDIVNSLLPLNPESNSSKNEHTDTLPSQAFQEKHSDNLSPEKSPTKCEFLLRKLKSVLLKGKRKVDLVTGNTTPNTLQDTEPCLKKNKEVDSETEVLKSDTNTLSTDAAVKEVPKMLPVDLRFAFALGLTPKVIPEKVTKTEDRDTPQKMDPTKTQEQMISDKQSQIIHRPPSIFTRRGRIKTLKKHQSISAECIKKKCTSPVSDSPGLLHHDQPMSGIKTLQPTVDQEDRSEHNKTPEYLKKRMVRKQKFRYSRTFVNKEGSIKVTRHWQENYDFNLDSKFTSDSKDKTIIRALHGPWDFSIQDTNEEVRLIVHMWIGLFYSRSTPRFFHVEPNFSYLSLEESDSVEMVSTPARYDHLATALASVPSLTDTSDPLNSTALDLSKKDEDQDSVVLDLSLRNSSACSESLTSPPQVNKKGTFDSSEQKEPSETLNSVKLPRQLYEHSGKMVNSKVNLTDMINVKKPHEGEKTSTPRKTLCLQSTDIPSFEDDEKVIPLQKVTDCASIKPDAPLAALGIGQVLHGCNEEKTNKKEGTENSGPKERSLVKQDVMDSFKFVKHEKNIEAEDVVQTDEHEKNKSKNLAICERKEDPCQKGNADPSQKVARAADDSAKGSDILCNGNCLESEKLLSREEHKAVSQEQHKSFKGVLVRGPKYKGEVMKDDPLDEKDDCISALKADKDLAHQPLPEKCNGPDLVNQNFITQSNHQAQMNEQPSLTNNTKDACHDLPDANMLRSDALVHDYSVSEKVSHTPFGIKSVNTESAADISKKARNEALKTAVFPLSTPQTKDNVEMKSQNKERSDFSTAQSDHEDQDNKSAEEVLKHDKEQFQHQPDSPQCELLKACEAQVSFTKETDLRTDETNGALDKNCTGVEIPFIGIKSSGENTIRAKDDNAADKQFQHQPHSLRCKVPKISEAHLGFMGKTDVRIDKTNEGMDKSCTGVEISFVGIDSPGEDTVQVKDNNAADKQFQHQPHSPQCKVPKMREAQLAFTEKTDVRIDKTNEGLDKCCTGVEIPFVGIDGSGEDQVQAKDDNATHKKTFQHQSHSPQHEFPKIFEAQMTSTKETDLRTEDTNKALDKNCTGVESPFTGIDSPGEDTVQIKDNNAADEQFQHQPHSPQCNVPKMCEAQLAFTEKTDVRIDKTNEGLDKCCTGVEIPFVGIDGSGEDTVQAKDDNATHKKTFQHQSHSPQHEFPKIFEAQMTSTKETDLRTEDTNKALDKNCTGVEIPFVGIDGSGEDTVQAKDDNATHKKTFQHQSHSPQCEFPKIFEAQVTSTKETDLRTDDTNEGLDKCCTGVEIPLIGIDSSGEDTAQVKDYSATDEQFQHQPHSLQSEVPKIFEVKVHFTKETVLRAEKIKEGLDKGCTGVEIPLIGIKSSGEDTVQPHGSLPHDGGEEVVQSQEEIPFISDSSDPKSALPNEVHSTSQECSKQAKPCKILLDVNERYRPVDLGSESDNRCPTPTIDEKPHGCLPRSSPSSSTSAFSGTETAKNLNHKSLSTVSAPVNGELPCEQKICHTSIFNTDSSPHQVFHPDLEVRTLRVLQSIDKFLSISDYTDKSCQIQTPKMKDSVDQSPNPSSKCIPSSLSFKDKKIGNNKPAAVPASVSQDLRKDSSEHLLVSPFKNKLEEVLGVKLHLKKTDSAPLNYFERVNIQENSVGQDSHSYSPSSTELLQVIKPSLDPERPKSTLQSSINHEPRPFSHRPVMAVKPSKNDESQADFFSIDVHTKKPLKSKPPKTPRLAYSVPKSILSEKRTKEKSRRHSERLDDNQEACQLSFKNTWHPDVDNSKSNSVESKFGLLDLSYQCQRKDISKFNTIPSSSPSVQSSESAESSSKLVDGVQCILVNGSVEKDEQTVKKSIEMDLKDSSSASASFMSQRDDSIDESMILGPQSSLVCTVYNNSHKRSYSFLEQVSQRCLQDDLTQASVEQECLIFSEQMKQVLKKSERWSIHQEDIHDNIRPSCSSPMTINFSNLDEQEDSLDQLGASLIGQKIKVDLSDRNDSTEKTEEDMLRPGEQSQGKDNSVEHDWVSDVTAECARLYEAKMHHVCAFKNVSSRAKHFRKNYTKTEPGNHYDFCDQMKKEMDKTFRTNLNSVVKKSCRTKYRFYILATSDDVFFEQTKAQLEAEGHTAIQPSDFFLGEDSSSSSIIIIRNEDIAEHICKVPHLLELKKSPSVQFAGIDEPDDVVNLTHQELFTQGGFIMFNRSTLDVLSLCKMKKVSEILLELSKMGKWKWMLHYRDSRRIKENARLSAEAKEKKHFLYWGQDAGLLEVLPYHECDQMSKDQPDYLTCLMRLQVQKISSRYPVFITDAAVDSGFEKNGILTMTSNSFLTKPLSEMFTV
ncbi:uncharacterized protein tasor2 isoform X2 [Archocentrus centrarchus]|uniref:uncharacterized protein tasor2 isoform X2 n=1 Tax=Archocentrus centrarchus TaxID=63155 RepID=UPI0011E9EB11|nr:uncharacterized protein LOC115781111 isoform X2 [Archocentrus centrarchus]